MPVLHIPGSLADGRLIALQAGSKSAVSASIEMMEKYRDLKGPICFMKKILSEVLGTI